MPPPPPHTHFQDATYIVHHTDNFKTKPEGYIIHVPADHSGELAASPVSIPAVPQLSGHTLSGEREREKGKGRGEKIAIYYCVYSVHVYVMYMCVPPVADFSPLPSCTVHVLYACIHEYFSAHAHVQHTV